MDVPEVLGRRGKLPNEGFERDAALCEHRAGHFVVPAKTVVRQLSAKSHGVRGAPADFQKPNEGTPTLEVLRLLRERFGHEGIEKNRALKTFGMPGKRIHGDVPSEAVADQDAALNSGRVHDGEHVLDVALDDGRLAAQGERQSPDLQQAA